MNPYCRCPIADIILLCPLSIWIRLISLVKSLIMLKVNGRVCLLLIRSGFEYLGDEFLIISAWWGWSQRTASSENGWKPYYRVTQTFWINYIVSSHRERGFGLAGLLKKNWQRQIMKLTETLTKVRSVFKYKPQVDTVGRSGVWFASRPSRRP